MSGRVTMLNISRWTDKGGSYRTIQRFFNTTITWPLVHWVLFLSHIHRPDETYILAGDDVTITKSGKQTFGLNKFFSSIYGKAVPGLCFFGF
ncbi:MAG: IS4 family transposase, partial [Phototrophicales bacterium]